MKTLPSRRRLLPRPVERILSIWWFVGFVAIAAVACWLFASRTGFIAFAAFFGIVLFGMLLSAADTRRLRRIAAGRPNDSICTFARAFDCRSTDTAVVRAVYEELQHNFTYATPAFPFRPSDHFYSKLKLDPEDLEDIIQTIAHRTGRTLEGSEANPLFGHVQTIHDLIQFFISQPTTGDA